MIKEVDAVVLTKDIPIMICQQVTSGRLCIGRVMATKISHRVLPSSPPFSC